MIKRFILLCLLVLGLSLPVRAATGLSTAILTNFYGTHFLVTPNAPPTQVIKLKLFGGGVTIVTNTFTSVFNVFSNVTQEFNYTTNIIDNSVLIITNTTVIINGETNDLTQLWTNKSGVYEPTATNASTIAFGRSVDTWWVPSTADGFVNIHDQAQGESQFNTIALAAIDDAASTTNYALFTVNVAGGDLVSGQLRGVALTNWQDPNAPVSKFMVRLEPRFGEAEMILLNNGETNFWITNNVTSVEAMRWIPHTNDVLLAGPQNIDVAHYSHVALSATNTDPSLTDILLSAPIFDGTFLLLRNITDGQGFTLLNGSPLYDTPTAHVTLQGGTWVTTNAGDGLLLTGSPEGWSEVFRWTQNTNVQTSQLWELVSGHMRTVPDTVDDWQFRVGGIPQLTVGSNGGGLYPGVDTLNVWGGPPMDLGWALASIVDLSSTEAANTANSRGMLVQAVSDPTWATYSQASLTTTSNGVFRASSYLFGGSIGEIGWGFRNEASETNAILQVSSPTYTNILFSPNSPVGTVPFILNSETTHTDDHLFELRNGTTNQLAFGPGAQIWFGEGGTNVLYRDPLIGRDLIYSNSYDYPTIRVLGVGGSPAYFGLTSGTYGAFAQASGPKGVALGWDVNLIAMGSSNLWPASPLNLGGMVVPFASEHLVGTLYNYGFNPLSGVDYARLAQYHTGTNGAVVFDSQSAGIAGDPRPINFRMGDTNLLQIEANGMIFSDRMTLQLSPGVGDTAFVSTLRGGVYRPIDITVNNTVFSVIDGLVNLQPGGSIPNSSTARAKALILNNTGSAVAGTQQWSPSLTWVGSGWSTGASTNRQVRYDSVVEPIQANEPTGMLRFYSHIGTSGADKELFGISTEGPIKIPSLTKAEKTALANLENGMLVYQTDNTPGLRAYINGAWVIISTAADP